MIFNNYTKKEQSGGGVTTPETCTVIIKNECVDLGFGIITLLYLQLDNGKVIQVYENTTDTNFSKDYSPEIIIENVICGSYFSINGNGYNFTSFIVDKYKIDTGIGTGSASFLIPDNESIVNITIYDND